MRLSGTHLYETVWPSVHPSFHYACAKTAFLACFWPRWDSTLNLNDRQTCFECLLYYSVISSVRSSICVSIYVTCSKRVETQSGRIVAELESMGVKKWSLWWASQKRHLISVYICFWISQFNFSYCLYLYYVGDFQALEISCLPVVMPILVVTLYRRCMTVADGVSMISALFGIYLVAQPNFIFHIFPESKTQPIM